MTSNKIEELEKQKDNAYWERNQLVAALSKVFPAHLAKHPIEDKEWEDDWRTIVVINLPPQATKRFKNADKMPSEIQLSWHIHDHEVSNFDHLKYYEYYYDGHTTEDKYKRLRDLALNQRLGEEQ